MDYKAILESQRLLEDGRVTFSQLLERFHSAGVVVWCIDMIKARCVYEDEYTQTIDLPLAVDFVFSSINENVSLTISDIFKQLELAIVNPPAFIIAMARAGAECITIYPARRQLSVRNLNGHCVVHSFEIDR